MSRIIAHVAHLIAVRHSVTRCCCAANKGHQLRGKS
jgi:hypothetical protein